MEKASSREELIDWFQAAKKVIGPFVRTSPVIYDGQEIKTLDDLYSVFFRRNPSSGRSSNFYASDSERRKLRNLFLANGLDIDAAMKETPEARKVRQLMETIRAQEKEITELRQHVNLLTRTNNILAQQLAGNS